MSAETAPIMMTTARASPASCHRRACRLTRGRSAGRVGRTAATGFRPTWRWRPRIGGADAVPGWPPVSGNVTAGGTVPVGDVPADEGGETVAGAVNDDGAAAASAVVSTAVVSTPVVSAAAVSCVSCDAVAGEAAVADEAMMGNAGEVGESAAVRDTGAVGESAAVRDTGAVGESAAVRDAGAVGESAAVRDTGSVGESAAVREAGALEDTGGVTACAFSGALGGAAAAASSAAEVARRRLAADEASAAGDGGPGRMRTAGVMAPGVSAAGPGAADPGAAGPGAADPGAADPAAGTAPGGSVCRCRSDRRVAGGVWIALAPGERRGSGPPDRNRSGCSVCPECTAWDGIAFAVVPGVRAGKKPRLSCPGVSPPVPGIRRGSSCDSSSGGGRLSSAMRRTPKLR